MSAWTKQLWRTAAAIAQYFCWRPLRLHVRPERDPAESGGTSSKARLKLASDLVDTSEGNLRNMNHCRWLQHDENMLEPNNIVFCDVDLAGCNHTAKKSTMGIPIQWHGRNLAEIYVTQGFVAFVNSRV